MIEHTCPEFTSVCPKTGQPDFATIRISYVRGPALRRAQEPEALPAGLPQPGHLLRGGRQRDPRRPGGGAQAAAADGRGRLQRARRDLLGGAPPATRRPARLAREGGDEGAHLLRAPLRGRRAAAGRGARRAAAQGARASTRPSTSSARTCTTASAAARATTRGVRAAAAHPATGSSATSRSRCPRWGRRSRGTSASRTSRDPRRGARDGRLRAPRHGGLEAHRRARSTSSRSCASATTTSASCCRPTCTAPPDDVKEAVRRGDRVRLCKGAYREPAAVALQDMDEIRKALHGLRARAARRRGTTRRSRPTTRRWSRTRSPTRARRRSRPRASSSRCSTACAARAGTSWSPPATTCASTCPSAPTGSRTSTAACASARRTCCFVLRSLFG